MTHRKRARAATRPIRIRRNRAAGLLVGIAAIAATVLYQLLPSSPSTAASAGGPTPTERRAARAITVPKTVWPAYGQAAVQIGHAPIQVGPHQHPAAIASVAKVMTAYLVLHDHPLQIGQGGPPITLTSADVEDTQRRRQGGESVVPVVAGERLTELEALQALLLPSANNIAETLARWDAGSVQRFAARMNDTARSLGMARTRYTDPSGYDAATVSTAADQLRLVDRAMRLPVFARIVGAPTVTLPVAGTVHNTNTLLGRDGFVGVKTGSTAAAGGCFAFRAIRAVHGTRTAITGVVLGQPGYSRIQAGLAAAADIVDGIAGGGVRAGLPQPLTPPGALPRTRARQRTGADANSTLGGNP